MVNDLGKLNATVGNTVPKGVWLLLMVTPGPATPGLESLEIELRISVLKILAQIF